MTPAQKIRQKVDSKFHPEHVNFWCHVLEGALAILGFQLVSGGEVLPVLVYDELKFDRQALGWVSSITSAAFLLPLLISPLLETGGPRKRLCMILGIGQRLPLAMIALGLALFGRSPDGYGIVYVIIVLSLLMQSMAARVNGGPWLELIAETVPSHRQGHLWGRRDTSASIMRIAAAPLCWFILAHFAFPSRYVILYATAFVFTVMSWLLFALVDEVPDHVPTHPRRSFTKYYGELTSSLSADPAFLLYIAFSVLRGLGATVLGFIIVEAIGFHGMEKAFVISFLMISRNLVRGTSSFISPYVAGRIGYKRLIMVGSFLTMVSALVCAFAPRGRVALYLFGALIWSLGGQARAVGAQSYLVRLLPRGRRVGYQAVLGAVTAVTTMISMPLMGYVLDNYGHAFGFYMGAVFTIACTVPLALCKVHDGIHDEPAEPPADEP